MGNISALKPLRYALDQINIPKGKVLILHIRLSPLKDLIGLDYSKLTNLILQLLEKYKPKSILVPAFTYSFTKSGLFHQIYSRSETGRFSEEVRNNFSKYRTPDPIFSMLDVKNWLGKQKDINCLVAFERGCIWEKLLNEESIIINIGLDTLVATQIHYLERLMDVPYRKIINKTGLIYKDKEVFEPVDYVFYARDFNNLRKLNWPLIEKKLLSVGVLNKFVWEGINFCSLLVPSLHKILAIEISRDPYYLVGK